jgi:hypothetical protein
MQYDLCLRGVSVHLDDCLVLDEGRFTVAALG